MPRLSLLVLLIALLCGCAAPVPTTALALSGDEGPTLTATFAPLPPTPTPTETPTPVRFSDSLGVTPDFATKLNSEGINSTITGEKGNWTVSQVITGWNQDGTPIVEQNIKIVSFEDVLVHNADYPDGILKGVDNQGKTVFWSEEEKAWVRPLEISTPDIENPPFYPWGKQYLAIETALLNPALNAPFSDEAVKNFQGWSINFEYDQATGSSQAYLRPRNNQSIRWALDENGKPVWFTTTTPDGTVYQSVLTQLLNPADPANPKGDETMFTLASAGEWWNTFQTGADANYRALFNSWLIKGENLKDKRRFYDYLLPQIILAQRNGWFANHDWGSFHGRPSLDSLLSMPGNDPSIFSFWSSDLFTRMNELGPSNTISETPLLTPGIPYQVPPEIQTMLLPLFFTTK